MIDFNLIETFLTLSKHKNLKSASQALCVTQSAISQRIKSLESQVGKSLFLRKSRGMELSTHGKELYKMCLGFKSGLANINTWAQIQRREVIGELRISTISGFLVHVFPGFLESFLSLYPNIKVTINASVTAKTEENIISGDSDIGIIIGKCKKTSLKTICLGDHYVYMVCSPSYFLAQKKNLTNKDLEKARLIWHADRTSRTVRELCKNFGMNYSLNMGDICLSDMGSCKEHAIKGLGVAFISRLYATPEVKKKRLVILPGFKMNRPVCMISRNERYEAPLISEFKKSFIQYCKTIEC